MVPSHWIVCKIKLMTCLITDGAHVSPETDEGVYDFVSTKDINEDSINFFGSLKTSLASYEYLVKTGCQPIKGDVLFSKDGTIGKTVIVREQKEFVVASSLIIIRPDRSRLNSSYLNYLCKSSFVNQQVDRYVKGAGLPRLSLQNLLRVFGVFPDIEEQRSIVHYLDFETSKIDALIEKSKLSIELSKEHRIALISAAVTGKIDVRGHI
jgi:type I restriction enzyme S subunit